MDDRAEFSEFSVAVASGPNGTGCLEFEKPLAELESQIDELKVLHETKGVNYTPEIRDLRRNLVQLTRKVYSHLTAWETVQVARHPRRPILADYLNSMVKDFCELHGDRHFGDDKAMVTGFGRIGREKVMVIGHNKGRDTKEKVICNFGCAQPEGYRKALLKMKLAEKFNLPIVCLIDTPGAYPGIGAEERGQSEAIARNLMEMSRLRVPIICVIIGEGGSGGALGIGVGDRLAMLQFSWYSVISPEGCAAILWKDGSKAALAAKALKLTSQDLSKLGVIEHIIDEPLGGAHRNPHEAVQNLEAFLVKSIRDLKRCKIENLLENRYRNLRRVGELSLETAGTLKAPVAKTSPANSVKKPSAKRSGMSNPVAP